MAPEAIRRSKREKRKPESIYEEAREALEARESQEWQESQEDDEDFETAMGKKNKKRVKCSKKKNVVQHANPLFGVCSEGKKKGTAWIKAVEAAAESLVESFVEGGGAHELVGFLLLASGTKNDDCISESSKMQDIDWLAVESELVSGDNESKETSSPSINTAGFRSALSQVMSTVIRQCGGRTDTTAACVEASVAISKSRSSAGRRVGTLAALAIASTAAEITEEAEIEVTTAEQRLRGAKQKARTTGIKVTLDRARERLACLKSARVAVLNGVVRQRWRDARSEVRLACLEGLTAWASVRPLELLEDKSLKEKIAAPGVMQIAVWALSFREAQERRAAAELWGHLLLVAHAEDDRVQEAVTRLSAMAASDSVLSVRHAALDALLCAPQEAIAVEGLFPSSCLRDDALRKKAFALALAVEGVKEPEPEEDTATLLYRVCRATQKFSAAQVVLAAIGGDWEPIIFDYDAYRRLLVRDDLSTDRARTVSFLLAAATESESSSDSTKVLTSGATLLARFADDEEATAALLRAIAASIPSSSEDDNDDLTFEALAKAAARCMETGIERMVLDAATQVLGALFDASRRLPNTLYKVRSIVERLTGTIAMNLENSPLAARRFARILGLEACPWIPTGSREQCSLAAALAADDNNTDNLEALASLRNHLVHRVLRKEVDLMNPDLAEYLGSLDTVGPALAARLGEIQVEDQQEEHTLLLSLVCEVLACGDPLFSFYSGLEALALPSYGELASSMTRSLALASSETLEELMTPLLELAKREASRASVFDDQNDDDLFPHNVVSSALLVSAALNNNTDVLQNAFTALSPSTDLILATHEQLALATEDDDDALLVAAATLAEYGDDAQNAAVLIEGFSLHNSRSLLALEQYVNSAAKVDQLPNYITNQRFDDPYRARLVSRICRVTKKSSSTKNVKKKKTTATTQPLEPKPNTTPELSAAQRRERRAAKRSRVSGSKTSQISRSRVSALDKIVEDDSIQEENEDEKDNDDEPPAKRHSPSAASPDHASIKSSKRRIISLSEESEENQPSSKRSSPQKAININDEIFDDDYSEDSPMPLARRPPPFSDDDTDLPPVAELERESSFDEDSEDDPCPDPPKRSMSYDSSW